MRLSVSEEIALSPPGPKDIPAYLEHLGEPEISETTCAIPYPYTLADAENWLAMVRRETSRAGTPLNWAIRNETGGLIGGIGFKEFKRGESAEIGYWIAKPYWGRGIATKSVRRLCEYAFSEFSFVRITALVFLFNEASCKVLIKAGFRFEGRLKKRLCKDGKRFDGLLYARVP